MVTYRLAHLLCVFSHYDKQIILEFKNIPLEIILENKIGTHAKLTTGIQKSLGLLKGLKIIHTENLTNHFNFLNRIKVIHNYLI